MVNLSSDEEARLMDGLYDEIYESEQWLERYYEKLRASSSLPLSEHNRAAVDKLYEARTCLDKLIADAEHGIVAAVARLPSISRTLHGIENQLNCLSSQEFPWAQSLRDMPWAGGPRSTLVAAIVGDPQLVEKAKRLEGDLAGGLMSHQQSVLDLEPPGVLWGRVLRLLQDVAQRVSDVPVEYKLTNKIDIDDSPGSRFEGGEATVRRAKLKKGRTWEEVVLRTLHTGRPSSSAPSPNIRIESCLQAITHWNLSRRKRAHENIVPIRGVIDEGSDSPLIIVLPWQEHGNALDFMMRYIGPDRDRVTVDLLIDAANGLWHMHGGVLPIAHGDPRAENILVSSELRGMLCDFGRTRVAHPVARSRSTASPGGSERYLAPELLQAHQLQRPTVHSDRFAFAMVILQLATLKHPFDERENTLSVGPAIVRGERPSRPRARLLAAPRGDVLWGLVTELWSSDPNERPTMNEVGRRLCTFRDSLI